MNYFCNVFVILSCLYMKAKLNALNRKNYTLNI